MDVGSPFTIITLLDPPFKPCCRRATLVGSGRNGCRRVPDASHTIECEETDASRTRPDPFLPRWWGQSSGRGAAWGGHPVKGGTGVLRPSAAKSNVG
eukprot:gene15210-biopygen3658